MTEDEYDTLLDDASHAVNDLIPDTIIGAMTDREHLDFMYRINDALNNILRDFMPSAP